MISSLIKDNLLKISTIAQMGAEGAHYAQRERKLWNEYPLPLRHRLNAWRKGFTSRHYVLFELADKDPENYLSSIQQGLYISPAANGEYSDILENKAAFHLSTGGWLESVPQYYGIIEEGNYYPKPVDDGDSFLTLIEEQEDVIVKQVSGTHGRGIFHFSYSEGGFQIDGVETSENEIREKINTLNRHIVTEYVENHEYSRSIYPSSVNTIRILVVKDPDTNQFFIGSAVHRFGNDSTGINDNWSSGGYAAPIEIDSGELGLLVSYSPETGVHRMERHPDTGTQVYRETVPQWEDIKKTVLEMAELHRENPYVGWDVVLTESGPLILEGNCAPGIALQQLGSGLLEDKRMRRFYQSQK